MHQVQYNIINPWLLISILEILNYIQMQRSFDMAICHGQLSKAVVKFFYQGQ